MSWDTPELRSFPLEWSARELDFTSSQFTPGRIKHLPSATERDSKTNVQSRKKPKLHVFKIFHVIFFSLESFSWPDLFRLLLDQFKFSGQPGDRGDNSL